MKVNEKSKKVGLKLNIQKTKITASVPSLHGKYMGKNWKQCQTLFWGLVAPQDEAGLTKTFQTWPRGWFHIP